MINKEKLDHTKESLYAVFDIKKQAIRYYSFLIIEDFSTLKLKYRSEFLVNFYDSMEIFWEKNEKLRDTLSYLDKNILTHMLYNEVFAILKGESAFTNAELTTFEALRNRG